MISVEVKHKGTELQLKLPSAVKTGLSEVGKTILRNSSKWLKGRGAKASNVLPGQYPVPVRTGNLRGHLGYAEPGSKIKIGKKEFNVPENKVLVFNSASYAKNIHNGTGTSAKYGMRPYIHDGLKGTDVPGQFDKGFAKKIHD